MSDPINLRLARKRRERAGKEHQAEENRVRFGRTKPERQAAERRREEALRLHEGHRLDRDPDPSG